MTAMAEEQPKKKASKKVAAPLHVIKPEPQPKPGEPGFDWQAEYPGEEVYIYTVPEGTKSPAGLTIGLAKITEDRAPNPGRMRRAQREGGFSPMWLFIECVSSPASLMVQEELRPPEYNDMLRGWSEFAGIELSE